MASETSTPAPNPGHKAPKEISDEEILVRYKKYLSFNEPKSVISSDEEGVVTIISYLRRKEGEEGGDEFKEYIVVLKPDVEEGKGKEAGIESDVGDGFDLYNTDNEEKEKDRDEIDYEEEPAQTEIIPPQNEKEREKVVPPTDEERIEKILRKKTLSNNRMKTHLLQRVQTYLTSENCEENGEGEISREKMIRELEANWIARKARNYDFDRKLIDGDRVAVGSEEGKKKFLEGVISGRKGKGRRGKGGKGGIERKGKGRGLKMGGYDVKDGKEQGRQIRDGNKVHKKWEGRRGGRSRRGGRGGRGGFTGDVNRKIVGGQ